MPSLVPFTASSHSWRQLALLAAAALGLGAYVAFGPNHTKRRKRRSVRKRRLNGGEPPGLTNFGTTCFVNAIIQALAASDEFYDWISQDQGQRAGNIKSPDFLAEQKELWLPHSGLSRNVVKQAIGLSPTHPLDRPVFAFLASICWWTSMMLWKPITNCSRLNVTEISLAGYFWRVPIVLTWVAELLGLF